MKQVKIISGLYGYKPIGSKFVTPIHAGEVVEVSDEEAERLVAIGIGLCIGVASPETGIKPVATPTEGENGKEGDSGSPKSNDGAERKQNGDMLNIVDGHFTDESLTLMTNKNLAKLADDMGVDVSKCKTKADMVAILTAIEVDEDEEREENPPDLNAEDPVT